MALAFVYLFTSCITFGVNLYLLYKIGEDVLALKTGQEINIRNLVKFFLVFIVSLIETMIASGLAKVIPAVLSVTIAVAIPFLCYYLYTCILLPKKQAAKDDNKEAKEYDEEHKFTSDDVVKELNEETGSSTTQDVKGPLTEDVYGSDKDNRYVVK